MLAKPKVRKEPVTANILKAMVEEAAGPEPPLSQVAGCMFGGICWIFFFFALQ